MKKYIMSCVFTGARRKPRDVYFNDIKTIENVADKLLGLGEADCLVRNPFTKNRARMVKGGPIIDAWESTDLLTLEPFRIITIETKYLETKE